MRKILLVAFIVILIAGCKKDEKNPPVQPEPPVNTDHLNQSIAYGSVSDQDGNEYATVMIGTQEWMAENLRTTKYCNGETIENVPDSVQWGDITTGAWAYYSNNGDFDYPFGKLYNWFAANDTRNVCPCGWHVPTNEEWMVLIDFLGGENVAGGKMKSVGMQFWLNPNTAATNESGFSGIASGFRGYKGEFIEKAFRSCMWSSTDVDSTQLGPSNYYTLYNLNGSAVNPQPNSPQPLIGSYVALIGVQYATFADALAAFSADYSEWLEPLHKRRGHSVRCIRD